MASNSSSEYKVIADKIVSPDEDIIIQISGDMYKGSISSGNKYVTASEAGGEASIADFTFDQAGEGGGSRITIHNHDMTIRTTRDDDEDADIDINSADDVWINAHDQIQITADNAAIDITAVTDAVYITAGGHRGEDGDTWEFNTDGSLTFPDNTTQTTAYTGDGSDTGNFVFDNNTVYVDNTDDSFIQSRNDNNQVSAEVMFDPGNDYARLRAYGNFSEESFSSENWTTATWVESEGDYIALTGAATIFTFLNQDYRGYNREISINGGARAIFGGSSGNGTDGSLFVEGLGTVTDPITSITLYSSRASGLEIDYDDDEMRLKAQNLDILITTENDISIEGNDVELQATDDVSFQSASGQEGGNHSWTMNSEGRFSLPSFGYIENPANSSGDDNTRSTIKIVPDSNLVSDQYLIIDPTSPSHIHLRAGGTIDASTADLILGGENTSVVVSDTTDSVILKGASGQFLNYSDPDNQIATVGDIADIYSGEVDFDVAGGTTGTQPTFTGDPLFTGSYIKNGAMVHFQIQVDMDNILTFGDGQYYVDLPFPAKYAYQFKNGCLHDTSTSNQFAIGGHVAAGASRMYLNYIGSNGQDEIFDHNSPVTLTTADNFHISGDYILDPGV